MNFREALEIIRTILPGCAQGEYDGIIVKRLEASNTLDEDGRPTRPT